MEEILNVYYAGNAKKLHGIVDRILLRFGGISDKDRDDFYSLANEVFVDVIMRYDSSQPFDGFLYVCLLNKIKTEITKRNREKRKVDRVSLSLDMPSEEDEDLTLADMVADCFDLEIMVLERQGECYSKKVLQYLNRLSKLQKDVLKLIVAGYCSGEIKKKLHIDEGQYADCHAAIHSYRNISVLF